MNCREKFIRRAALTGVLVAAIGMYACASVAPSQGSSVLAVWDLEELSPLAIPNPHLGNLLAGQIMAHVDAGGRYKVVDRDNLMKILEELQLGSSELADPGTRLRLGRIMGAEQMVFGAFQMIGRMQRVDLRLVDVSTGKILKTASGMAGTADLNGWLLATDQAAAELLK
jgi:hypothetical protein